MFFKREIEGLRISIFFKLAFAIFFIVVAFAVAASALEIIATILVAVTGILISLISLIWLQRRRLVNVVGMINSGLSVAIICVMPFIWYASAGGDAIPRTYMPKTYLYSVIFGLMILDGLALRPIYPLLVAAGASLNYVFLFYYAAQDPRFTYSDDYVKAILGDHLHLPAYIITNFFSTLLVGAALAVITYRARKTTRQVVEHQAATAQLSRYFSPGVAERLSKAGAEFMRPGGEEKPVAVLFSDIRGFTSMSEKMSPTQAIAFLTEYHSLMVDAIFQFNGALDKFIGDAILATFGAPESSADDPERAVRTALAMNEALLRWNQRRKATGLPPVEHGIGLHFGPAVVGNIGARNRLEYTVIGDTVNAASRIEASCKELGRNLLFSAQVAERLPADLADRLIQVGKIQLRGKSELMELYSI
jgi:adenylate cyclase